MIPQETIERVRAASDVAEIIGGYVRLKRRGRNFIGLCPFHSEKTPSFTVSPDKQIYHCFGCSTGGNVYSFLMEHEKLSFSEAVHFLASKAGIVVKETRSDFKKDEFERLHYANQVALEYFRKVLISKKYGPMIYPYLKEKRGLTDETIELFQLGLAGEEWDGLIQYAAKKDLNLETLEKAGLVVKSQKQQTYFDRFRQRLMIPIFNLSRKPIAFGGRTLKKGEPAKYVNSPETPLYSKSNVLYGLNYSRDALRKMNFVYVVEGYFDVISLCQTGIQNVVASSGTAFTLQQAKLIARFVNEVYLFFDSDSAGQKAALRSVDVLYDAGLDVKIIQADEGEDPDSIAQSGGRNRIEELKEQAVDFLTFRTRDLSLDDTGIVAKEKLVKEIVELGQKISDPTRRSLFFDEAADKLSVNRQLFDLRPVATSNAPVSVDKPKDQLNRPEQQLLSLLLCNPKSVSGIYERIAPTDFQSEHLGKIYEAMFHQYQATGDITVPSLIEDINDPTLNSMLTRLAAHEWNPEVIDEEIKARLDNLIKAGRKRIRKQLMKELAQAEARGDQKRANELIDELKLHGLEG